MGENNVPHPPPFLVFYPHYIKEMEVVIISLYLYGKQKMQVLFFSVSFLT